MGRYKTALALGGLLLAFGGSALSHHSFAMFDQENPVDLVGSVQEFKFTSPHTFILLKVEVRTAEAPSGTSKAGARARSFAMAGRARRSSPATN